jgi:hypothetical protein
MNRREKIRITAIVLGSATAVFFGLNRVQPVRTQESQAPAPHIQHNPISASVAQPVHFAKPLRAGLPVSALAPRVEEVRDEIRKNPEGTPPSLILFASRMGQRFQIARLSQNNAAGFFEELNSCLDPASPIATTAKAFCLTEGERLTHYFPVLRANYDLLAIKASPEVRNLALHGRVAEKSSK